VGLFRRFKGTRATDVFFLHVDNLVTRKKGYTSNDLRIGLLLHLLYTDRVLVPVNLLLSNQELGNLFEHKGKISEHSEVYKLFRAGAIVPTLFRRDYGSISEYARYAIEKENILLTCPDDVWVERASLLDEFSYAVPNGDFRSTYRDALVSLLHNKSVQDIYLSKVARRRSSRSFIQEFVDQIKEQDSISRSVAYRLAAQAPPKVRDAIEQVVDASYYATFSTSYTSSIATSPTYSPAILEYYLKQGLTGRPVEFSRRFEDDHYDNYYDLVLPNLADVSLASAYNDLKDSPLRKKWLRTLKKKIEQGIVDPSDKEVESSLIPWSQLVIKYLSTNGHFQRQKVAKEAHRVSLKVGTIKKGRDVALVASVAFLPIDAMQMLNGGPPMGSMAFTFAAASAELLMRRVERNIQKNSLNLGSMVPLVSDLFTLRGKRPG